MRFTEQTGDSIAGFSVETVTRLGMQHGFVGFLARFHFFGDRYPRVGRAGGAA